MQKKAWLNILLILLVGLAFASCKHRAWNNPYPSQDDKANIYYASFSEQPKTLDPARSYSSDESVFTAQIYEPPLQYDYLKRPYTLTTLTATEVPQPIFLDANQVPLPSTVDPAKIVYSVYQIHIKPGIYYQPHPAFAKNDQSDDEDKNTLSDFRYTGTRELTADDYVYEIKRLADPHVQSPIYGFLSQYIVGFPEFNATLQKIYSRRSGDDMEKFLDLRQFPLLGAQVVDRYTYQIVIKGYYPQFLYWLAMPFFSPMPWEVDDFYTQPGMVDNNITLDWYPVGTGPYMLEKNNPNREMVLVRNPNFHGEYYPRNGTAEDVAQGLLVKAGQPLPFIDKFVFTLEKESIPRWTKFLQGYYDQSAIGSDSFDQAIRLDNNNHPEVTPLLKEKGIRLQTTVSPSIFYLGFNMLDPIVGGHSESARKLRLAISIAFNYEEFISIFLNGRGIPAQGPVPPGIFGYEGGAAGIDPYVYNWIDDHAERKSLAEAKKLLSEAGYPNGRDPKTGTALLLNFDTAGAETGDDKALFSWMRKQFAQLGIELQVRATQFNRFQEKVRTGQVQLFMWGWSADYPDPENFLFLLYGPNGKVKYGGENATNYSDPAYDHLFEQMRNLPNNADRAAVIKKMLAILDHDAPWSWGFYPQSFLLRQPWVADAKPNEMANNTLKYLSIDPVLRAQDRNRWNQPVLWPLGVIFFILVLGLLPLFIQYRRRRK